MTAPRRSRLRAVPHPGQLSLDDLAAEINREYHTVLGSPHDRIEAAIRIGDRLLAAQALVDTGEWWDWLGGLDIHRTTAYRYMRLAKHQDEVRQGNYDGIDPALAALGGGTRKRRTEAERDEMVRMARDQGLTADQIAEALGVAKSTVWYWTSKKNRDRRGTQRRATRARERREEMRQEGITLSRVFGGSVEKAYSYLRRCQQQVDKTLDDNLTGDARIALRRALGHLHAAEDELTRAMKLSRTRRD